MYLYNQPKNLLLIGSIKTEINFFKQKLMSQKKGPFKLKGSVREVIFFRKFHSKFLSEKHISVEEKLL